MSERKQINYAKLREKKKKKYGSIEKTAEASGLRRDMISLALNGKRQFTQADILTLARVLEIEDEEIGAYFFKT